MLTLFLVICELEFLFIYFLCYFSEEFDPWGNSLFVGCTEAKSSWTWISSNKGSFYFLCHYLCPWTESDGDIFRFFSNLNFPCFIFRFWKLILWPFQMLLMLYWPMACSVIMIAHVLDNYVKRLACSYGLFRFFAS